MLSNKELLDQICNDNDYLLTFQVTQASKNLAKALIDVRDGITNNFEKTLECLKLLDDEITNSVNALNTNDKDYAISLSYLEDVRYGVTTSINRLNNVQMDVANLSINEIENV